MILAAAGLLVAVLAASSPAQSPPAPSESPVVRQRVVAVIRQATRHYEAGEYQAAYDRLAALPEGPAGEAEAMNLRGAILTRLGRYAEARAVFAGILQADPQHMPAAFNIGEVELLAGEHEAALAAFREVLERDPRNELARFKVVVCELQLGRDGDARETAAGLIPAGGTPAWYFAQAVFARKAGDAGAERRHLQAARAIYGEEGCGLFDESMEQIKF
jgi:tetratricopeptide (TPR) repeat protein